MKFSEIYEERKRAEANAPAVQSAWEKVKQSRATAATVQPVVDKMRPYSNEYMMKLALQDPAKKSQIISNIQKQTGVDAASAGIYASTLANKKSNYDVEINITKAALEYLEGKKEQISKASKHMYENSAYAETPKGNLADTEKRISELKNKLLYLNEEKIKQGDAAGSIILDVARKAHPDSEYAKKYNQVQNDINRQAQKEKIASRKELKADYESKQKQYLDIIGATSIPERIAQGVIGYTDTTNAENKIRTEYTDAAARYFSTLFTENELDVLSKAIQYKKETGRTNIDISKVQNGYLKEQLAKIENMDNDELDLLKKGIDAAKGKTVDMATVVGYVSNAVNTGITNTLTAVAETGEFLVGTPIEWIIGELGGDPNVISIHADAKRMREDAHNAMTAQGKALGDKYNIVGQCISTVIENIPNIILAMGTGGASTAAQLGSSGMSSAIASLSQNPMFWTTFVTTSGSSYYEAIDEGASPAAAATFSLLESLVNAYIEIGGGIETLPSELANAATSKEKLLQWVISSLEEGGEETLQGAVTELTKRVRDAVDTGKTKSLPAFDIKEHLKGTLNEAAMGVLGGAVLGGGNITFDTIINRQSTAQYKQLGAAVVERDSLDALIKYAESSENADLRENVDKLTSNNPEYVGKVYTAMCSDINTRITTAPTIETATEGFRSIVQDLGAESPFVPGIAVPQYMEVGARLGVSEADIAANFISVLSEEAVKQGVDNYDEGFEDEFDAEAPAEVEEVTGAPRLTEPSSREIVPMPTGREATEDALRRMNGQPVLTGVQQHVENTAKKILGDGSKLVWDESVPVGEGRYNTETKTISLNPDSSVTQNYAYLFKHEFTHSLEGKAKYEAFKTWCLTKSASFKRFVEAVAYANGIQFDENATAKSKLETVRKWYVDRYAEDYGDKSDAKQIKLAEMEMVADYVGDLLFNGQDYNVTVNQLKTGNIRVDADSSLTALEEIAREDRSFIQMLKDFIHNLRLKLRGANRTLAEDLEYAEKYLEKVYKSAEVDSKGAGVVKYSKGYYNEFATLAKQWAYNRNTKPGDMTIRYRGKTAVLISATEDGYIEISSGKYSEMRGELERIYSKENTGIYGNLETLRSEQRGNLWDLQYDENGRYGTRNSESFRGQELQDNATGNDEYMRSSDRGSAKQISNENEASDEGAFSLPENEKSSKGSPIPSLRYNTEVYARHLIRKGNSTIDAETVTQQLREIVKAYNKFEYDRAAEFTRKLTREIAEYAKPVRQQWAQEYLDNIKGATIRVYKEDLGDIYYMEDTLRSLKDSTGIRFVISENEAREWLAEKGERITSQSAFKRLCQQYGLVIDNDGQYSGLDTAYEIEGVRIDEDSSDMSPIEQLKNAYEQAQDAYEEEDAGYIADMLAEDINDQLKNTGGRAENRRVTEARREGKAAGEKLLEEHKRKQKQQREASAVAARMKDLQKRTERLLKSFERRLVKPTRSSHIPTELIRACVDALEIVQQNPVLQDEVAIGSKYAAELEMLNQRIQNATTEEERDKWKAKYERKLHIATAIADKVQKIQDIFEKFKNDKKYSEIYTQGIIDALINLKQTIQDTEPYNYDEHQLLTVLNTFAMLDTLIKNQDRMIASKIKQEVSFVAQTFMDEVKRAGGKLWAGVDTYVTALTDPKRYFDRLGNYEKDSAASQIYNMLNEGSQNAMRYKMEAQYIFRHLLSGSHNIKEARALQSTKRADLVDSGLVTEDGKRIMVTKAMRISLFMHSLNEQNMKHLMSKVYVRDADVYGYIKDVISWQENIAKALTNYEVEWVKALREYYGKYSADHLNEVTRELYGFEKAIVPNYFPIKTVSDYTRKPMEDISYDFSLEAAGFMKNRVDASNPLELVDAIAQINSDIDRHAKFYGLAIPMRNFNMVYNYTAEGWSESVKDAINQKFERNKPQEYVIEGPEGSEIVIEQKKNKEKPINAFTAKGTQYIEKMISDLIKRSDREVSIFDTLRGRYAQAVLAFNIPVSLKQAASYPTAIATLGWKPILKALAVIEREGGSKAFGFARAEQELIKKYSPLLWYRIQGGTDTELHDIFAKKNAGDQLSSKAPWLFNWIQKVDTATVGRLWYAAKYYVDDNFRGLTKDSDAYYKKVAEVFNKIIEETQPNYNTLQRPQILRSQNQITQTVTMFYTQRLQNMNILIGSALELKATLKNVKTGHATESDVKQAKRKLGRVIISQVVAANVLSLMQLAASALINNMKPYRDDDDELTVWSVLSGYFNTVFETLIGSALFGTEVYAIGKTLLSAGKWYGLSDPSVESINNLVNNGIGVVNGIKKSVKLTKDGASVSDIILAEGKTLNNLACAIARFAGVPLENMEKVGLGIYNDAKDLFQGEAFASAIKDNSVNQFFGEAIQSKSQKYNVIYKALQDGDTEKAERKYKELIDSKTKESDINKGIMKVFKEDYKVKKQSDAAIKKLSGNKSYKSLDDDGKSDVQTAIENYFAKKAMQEVFGHTSENYKKAVAKVDDIVDKGISVDIYFVAKEMFKAKYADKDKSGGVSKAEKQDALDRLDASQKAKDVLKKELIG